MLQLQLHQSEEDLVLELLRVAMSDPFGTLGLRGRGVKCTGIGVALCSFTRIASS